MIQAIPSVLIANQVVPNTQTTLYTSPTGTTTIVDSLVVCNTSVSAITITINVVPAGGTASTSNILIKAASVSGGQTEQIIALESTANIAPIILGPLDFISVIASAATGLNILCGGRQCS